MHTLSITCLDCKTTSSEQFAEADIARVVKQYSTCKCGSKRVALTEYAIPQVSQPKVVKKRYSYSGPQSKRYLIFSHKDFPQLLERLTTFEQSVVRMRINGLSCGMIGQKMEKQAQEIQAAYLRAVTRLYRILAAGDYETTT